MQVGTRPLNAHRLPEPLDKIATVGEQLTIVAVGLVVVAFLTNPSPTQDLLGWGLPVTLPVSQPRWGHSVASYMIGMWMLEFTFPLALLAAYDRWADSEIASRRWLLAIPTVYMLVLSLYCRVVYVPNVTPTPLGPAATTLCWAYCATGIGIWSDLALGTASLGLIAWVAASRQWYSDWLTAVLFGFFSLPLGIPAIWYGLRARRRNDSLSN
jgi:hypothetical protein